MFTSKCMVLSGKFLLIIAWAATLWACSGEKKEFTGVTDSTRLDSAVENTEEISDAEAEELEDFNNEDHGAPGITDTRKPFSELDINIQDFLISLRTRNVQSIIDSGFLIMSPGPGVKPVLARAHDPDEFLSVSEVNFFFGDTLRVNQETPIYTWPFEQCNADDLPDGVYINTSYLDPLDENISDENQLQIVKDLNKRIAALPYRYATDFNFKFTEDGIPNYLRLRTFFKDGKLYVLMIDRRDCAA
jgi:hypothetical protein